MRGLILRKAFDGTKTDEISAWLTVHIRTAQRVIYEFNQFGKMDVKNRETAHLFILSKEDLDYVVAPFVDENPDLTGTEFCDHFRQVFARNFCEQTLLNGLHRLKSTRKTLTFKLYALEKS
uniref:Uncharacterized protein n=1 Tax=Chromera velia CCMP2878 TaxID=1169474 RepID=A0A0G4GZ09_9ALVE|eukprot:Cvel_23982.t1-p1 / transcript=Cvel_23982.t1 / gene=Cvel_23982 / organism=Chromera_velia_CCMP2878 / gene_product=hypothetical protein / transcript_product=hypothetical protein / location=Cvel_scaffold2540:16989-17348(-) / protein_length=120 / sequence_SO=supercontig / SO=protein_coding / is_pseudo=false